MSPRSSLVIAAAALVVGACASATQQKGDNAPTRGHATVAVQNDNWLEVAIYVVRGSQRVRLGSVRSMSKAEFTIPQAYVLGTSEVTLEADPVGARETYVSPPIQVYDGARVQLKIEKHMPLSSFAVFATQ